MSGGESVLRALFAEQRGWFGYAPRTYRGRTIDGRERIRVAQTIGIAVPTPVDFRTPFAAARWLALMGHYERCVRFCLDEIGEVPLLHVPIEVQAEVNRVAKVLRARELKRKLNGQRERRGERPRSSRIVRRCERLLAACLDRGEGPSIAELRVALQGDEP